MNEEPFALRLAGALEQLYKAPPSVQQAADELRRLHIENINQRDWLVEWDKSKDEANRLRRINQELVEAFSNVLAHLVAAHSLLQRGGKKAAPSDTIFMMMLKDCEKSIDEGRAALAKARGEA